MGIYEEATAGLLKLLATGAFFSDRVDHDQVRTRCIKQLATRNMEHLGDPLLLKMQQYPTLLSLYAIGLGSVAADRLEPIARALGTIARSSQSNSQVQLSIVTWSY